MTAPPRPAARYRVAALANLRHWLPGAAETADVDCESPLAVEAILRRAGIPPGEVMLVLVDGQPVDPGAIPPDGSTLELYPVLSGG